MHCLNSDHLEAQDLGGMWLQAMAQVEGFSGWLTMIIGERW
jgi:hypothetical protein